MTASDLLKGVIGEEVAPKEHVGRMLKNSLTSLNTYVKGQPITTAVPSDI